MTGRASIADQADEVGREVRQRERIYPDWIVRGRIREETAARKLATMRDAEASLRFLARHAAGFRALAHFLIAAGTAAPVPTPEETEALRSHPAVAALLAQWPDAEMTVLGPPQPPSADEAQPELFTEEEDAS